MVCEYPEMMRELSREKLVDGAHDVERSISAEKSTRSRDSLRDQRVPWRLDHRGYRRQRGL